MDHNGPMPKPSFWAKTPSSRVAEVVALAQACHLPQAFIDAISPP